MSTTRRFVSCLLGLVFVATLTATPSSASACDTCGCGGFDHLGHYHRGHRRDFHRGRYTTDFRRHNRYWGSRISSWYHPPTRYAYGHSFGRYPVCYSYYPRYSSRDSSYQFQRYPNYGPASTVEVYEGGERARPLRDAEPVESARAKDGWELLARGNAAEAQAIFSAAAKRSRDDGGPKLGYALASAMLKDDATATYAMRRVLKHDAQALDGFTGDDRMRRHVRSLIDRYAYLSTQVDSGTDPMFMTAALYYLMGERDLAREAISPAIRFGDRDTTTIVLREMIDGETDAPVMAAKTE